VEQVATAPRSEFVDPPEFVDSLCKTNSEPGAVATRSRCDYGGPG